MKDLLNNKKLIIWSVILGFGVGNMVGYYFSENKTEINEESYDVTTEQIPTPDASNSEISKTRGLK